MLFEEKLDLLAALRSEGPLNWSGTTRLPLTGQRAYPTTERGSLPVWVAVGGTPASVVRAAEYKLPLMLAIIGGPPARFRPFVDLYRSRTARAEAAGWTGLMRDPHLRTYGGPYDGSADQ